MNYIALIHSIIYLILVLTTVSSAEPSESTQDLSIDSANQTFEIFDPTQHILMSSMASRLTLPRSIFNKSLINSIHQLWFDPLPPSITVGNSDTKKKWFGVGATPEEKKQFDSSCVETSLEALNAIGPDKWPLPKVDGRADERQTAAALAAPFAELVAEEGALSEEAKVDTALSIAVLLDQMPRNLFRNEQDKIYSHFDRLSRAFIYCIRGLNAGDGPAVLKHLDEHERYKFSSLHRTWFLMPLMHSEYIEDHDEFTKAATHVKNGCDAKQDQAAADDMRNTLAFEESHRKIIERFGRYPYRNEWMGRKSTPEEVEWIKSGGTTFGS